MSKRYNGCVHIDDSEMYYVAFGEGKKVLVVLPGLSDGLTSVKNKAYLLSKPYEEFFKDYTVYMFSRKEHMKVGYSIKDMARDHKLALESLGISKASIMGVSQGGMIATCMAIEYKELVEQLILVVSAPYCNDILKENVTYWIELAKSNKHVELMMDSAEKMYSESFMSKNRLLYSFISRFTKPKSYDRFLVNAYAILDFDVRDKLDQIECPTYVIAGDEDRTVGNEAVHEFQKGIKKCDVLIYKGLGHGLFEEAKDFYSNIYRYLKKSEYL